MGFSLGKLAASVAGRIAIIAVGPLVGFGLAVGVAIHTQTLREVSEAEFSALQARLAQVDAFNNHLALISAQVTSFLDVRSAEAASSIRQKLAEARNEVDGFKSVEDEAIRTSWRGLTSRLDQLKDIFEDLDAKVALVGRSVQEGLVQKLDSSTEMAQALFEGALSTDERFRAIAQGYAEFRGAALRFNWLRDPKLENRVEFMRTSIMTRLSSIPFEVEQVKTLKKAVEQQGESFSAWRLGIQEETFLRNSASDYVADAREWAGKLRNRASELLAREREHNAEVAALANRLTMMATALAAVISIGLIALIGRGLSKALSTLSNAMGRVASGDTDAAIPSLARKDEIGAMARALEVFQRSIAERAALASQSERDQRERLERGQRVEASIAAFAGTIDAALASLKGSAERMDEASAALDRDSSVLAEHSGVAGQATAIASGEINSVAASATQLTASVEEVSHQAMRSTMVASRAVEQSERASTLMHGLMDEASRIGDVVALIRSITEQTNLLALNATIEAARAGEAGKGFAVVASEVKALASQTAHATEEISAKISGIQTASGDAGEAIGAIGHILSEMSAIATSVAAAVEEQSSAINAISANVNIAAQNAEAGASAIHEAEARVQAGRQTARDVGAAASAVASQTAAMESHISRFLQEVRA